MNESPAKQRACKQPVSYLEPLVEDPPAKQRACRQPVSYLEPWVEGEARPDARKEGTLPIHALILAGLQRQRAGHEPACVCTVASLVARAYPALLSTDWPHRKFLELPVKGTAATRLARRVGSAYSKHQCPEVVVPEIADGMMTLLGGSELGACFWEGDGYVVIPAQKTTGSSYLRIPVNARILYNGAPTDNSVAGTPTPSLLVFKWALVKKVRDCKLLLRLSDGETKDARAESSEESGVDEEAEDELMRNKKDAVLEVLPGTQARAWLREFGKMPPEEQEIARAMFYREGDGGQFPRVNPKGARAMLKTGIKGLQQAISARKVVPAAADEDGPPQVEEMDFEQIGKSLCFGPHPLAEMHFVFAAFMPLMKPRAKRGAVLPRTPMQLSADLQLERRVSLTTSVPRCFNTVAQRFGVDVSSLGVLAEFFQDRLLVAWLALVAFGRVMETRGLDSRSPARQRYECWLAAGVHLRQFREVLLDDALVRAGLCRSCGDGDAGWFERLLKWMERLPSHCDLFQAMLRAWQVRLSDDARCPQCLERFCLAYLASVYIVQEEPIMLVPADHMRMRDLDFDDTFVVPCLFKAGGREVVEPGHRGQYTMDQQPEHGWMVGTSLILATLGDHRVTREALRDALRYLDVEQEIVVHPESPRLRLVVVQRPAPVKHEPAPASSPAPSLPGPSKGRLPAKRRQAKPPVAAVKEEEVRPAAARSAMAFVLLDADLLDLPPARPVVKQEAPRFVLSDADLD